MRIQIWVEIDERYTDKQISWFINDFPARPQKDDLIMIESMLGDEDFDKDQIYSLFYLVEFLEWEKDEEGIYLKVYCKGE